MCNCTSQERVARTRNDPVRRGGQRRTCAVPTIKHSAYGGGHASLCPPNNSRPFHLSGKSPKTCPVPFTKIFRLTCRANHLHNSARLTADEGRSRSSRTRGEMRWTRELRLTCVAQAYGEVVWFGRRGAGATLAGSVSPITEAKEPFSGKSTK